MTGPAGGGVWVRPFGAADVEDIVAAFEAADWPKPRAQYERYLAEQDAGLRLVLLALLGRAVAGYLTLVWQPDYPPFRQESIPEVQDLNVLPGFRRRGIASALLDEVERRAAERAPIVGLGVGLYAAYGPAQRLYVLRGYVPDGRGATAHHRPLWGGEEVRVDDALALYLTKRLRP